MCGLSRFWASRSILSLVGECSSCETLAGAAGGSSAAVRLVSIKVPWPQLSTTPDWPEATVVSAQLASLRDWGLSTSTDRRVSSVAVGPCGSPPFESGEFE